MSMIYPTSTTLREPWRRDPIAAPGGCQCPQRAEAYARTCSLEAHPFPPRHDALSAMFVREISLEARSQTMQPSPYHLTSPN